MPVSLMMRWRISMARSCCFAVTSRRARAVRAVSSASGVERVSAASSATQAAYCSWRNASKRAANPLRMLLTAERCSSVGGAGGGGAS
ncbi:MAG TPA: hypothetical protein DEV75_13710 [Desulfovibrio sp.]|nr:hypothetical protein [Desulfovibrio sp.]